MSGSFFFNMTRPFNKHYSSPHDLVDLLISRRLTISDKLKAEKYLKNIGYYRLSAYMYPLLEAPKNLHQFKPGSSFSQVLCIYRFDKKLRLLMFNEIEKIENKRNTIRAMIPNTMLRPWITLPTDSLRIYFNLCIIKYFVDVISQNNHMKKNLLDLLAQFPNIDIQAMGFPSNWEQEPIWQN